MSRKTRALVVAASGVAVLSGIAVFVQFWDSVRFESWTREDGPIENLQALFYGLGSVAFLLAASRDRRNAWKWLFGIGLFLCAGEEISWGQRIIGFSTPSELNGVNIQHEANLHNVENIHGNVRTYGFLALGLMFVLLPIADQVSRRVRMFRQRLAFPFVPLLIVPVAMAAFGFMSVPRYIDSNAFGFDEVGELFTSCAMCLYGLVASYSPKHLSRTHAEMTLGDQTWTEPELASAE